MNNYYGDYPIVRKNNKYYVVVPINHLKQNGGFFGMLATGIGTIASLASTYGVYTVGAVTAYNYAKDKIFGSKSNSTGISADKSSSIYFSYKNDPNKDDKIYILSVDGNGGASSIYPKPTHYNADGKLNNIDEKNGKLNIDNFNSYVYYINDVKYNIEIKPENWGGLPDGWEKRDDGIYQYKNGIKIYTMPPNINGVQFDPVKREFYYTVNIKDTLGAKNDENLKNVQFEKEILNYPKLFGYTILNYAYVSTNGKLFELKDLIFMDESFTKIFYNIILDDKGTKGNIEYKLPPNLKDIDYMYINRKCFLIIIIKNKTNKSFIKIDGNILDGQTRIFVNNQRGKKDLETSNFQVKFYQLLDTMPEIKIFFIKPTDTSGTKATETSKIVEFKELENYFILDNYTPDTLFKFVVVLYKIGFLPIKDGLKKSELIYKIFLNLDDLYEKFKDKTVTTYNESDIFM